MTNPTLITTPFAENGDKNIIPESVGANPQNATMQAGFPPITQQKISEGGIPPERNDFNGILNLYGQHIVHLNKGLPYEFDQDFSDAIGGYPLNARVMLDNGDIVKSTVPNNANNPNSDMTGWVDFGNYSTVPSIQGLTSIQNPKDGDRIYVESYHSGLNKGGGYFTYDSTKSTVNNGVTIFNGWVRDDATNLSVYDAGVKNSTDHNDYNDHDSLRKLASVITSDATTSYVIDFADSNIIVGKAVLNTNATMQASEMPFLLDFRTVSPSGIAPKSIKIKANGAKIQWRNGMKLGTFLRSTGERYDPVMPFYPNTASWNAQKDNVYVYPASFMIRVINVDSFSAEGEMYLDGNAAGFIKGGGYGDKDWQLGGYGLQVYIVNKYHVEGWTSNDQPSDGFYLACTATPESYGIAKNLTALRNGRQACSMTGGHNISYYDCNFRDSGIASLPFPTAPKSNVDLEGEVAQMRNVNFYNCKFIGAGNESVVSASQDTRNVNFFDCDIEGEKSIWIDKPQFTFYGGTIKGAIQKLYGTNIDADRVRFFNVDFSDETMVNSGGWLIQAANGNPLFEYCRFKITKSAWFFNTYTAITGTPFKLVGCTVDFSYQVNALSGVFVFDDLTIIDNRSNPMASMVLNFANVYQNVVKIASSSGLSNLTYSGGRLYDPVPNSNIAKLFIGNPALNYNVHTFEYVHKLGSTGAPTPSTVLKSIYADNIANITANTLQYNKGDTVHCTDPVARNGITKWVCTTGGYYNTTGWAASTAYTVNAYVNANGKVYKCTVAGTSGTTAPNHTSGTAIDGTVTWEYVGVLAVFAAYGAKGASVANATGTDDTSVKLNALISSLRNAGFIQ